MKKYLLGGSTLTPEQRREAERLKAEIQPALDCATLPGADGARLAMVAKMLLAYPAANPSFDAARARGEAYMDALDDVPPWALQEAIRAWHRGEGEGNHDFAPAPARLRELCLKRFEQHRRDLARLNDLLNAVTEDEIFGPRRAAPAKPLVPRLRPFP